MTEYVFIDGDSINEYIHFTFQKYRLLTLIADNSQYCAIGARVNGRPAGLVLSRLMRVENTAVLLSLFVERKYRRKGIGKTLVGKLESYLSENDYYEITAEYIRNSCNIRHLERILDIFRWNKPQLKTLICRIHYKRLLKSGWLTKYRLPNDFSIFRWSDITCDERKEISANENIDGWFAPNLNPFTIHESTLSSNSLGLRYKGRIIGWIIVLRMPKNSLNYAKLFVCREFQDMGKIIILLSEAIKIQAKEKIKYGCFTFDMDNKKMKLFYEKRFKPYVNRINEKMYSCKLLKQEI